MTKPVQDETQVKRPVFRRIGEEKVNSSVRQAVLIHDQAIVAINNFHDLYLETRQRSETEIKHGENDLLRAMLLFACSGLDAVVKQIIQDGLEKVLESDAGAQREFKKFAERRLKRAQGIEDQGKSSSTNTVSDVGFLAEVMVSFNPRATLIEALMRSLTSDSLQSSDQILKVGAHFALTRDDLMQNAKVTKEAFDARNQITHEMDVNLKVGNERRSRDYSTMVRWCENIADISFSFIEHVASKTAEPASEPAASPIPPT